MVNINTLFPLVVIFSQHWENYDQLITCSIRGWKTSFFTEMTVMHGYGGIQLRSEIVYGYLLSVIRILISTSTTSKASDIHCIHLFMYKICTDQKTLMWHLYNELIEEQPGHRVVKRCRFQGHIIFLCTIHFPDSMVSLALDYLFSL